MGPSNQGDMGEVEGCWGVYDMAVTDPVPARAGQGWPIEPLRTLDAIHLATAPIFSQDVLLVTVLSTDRRGRDNAQRLGLSLAPPA